MRYLFFLFGCCLLTSCWTKKYPTDYDNVKKWAWKPVYGANVAYKKLTWHNSARPVLKAGKIYVFGTRIFQSDVGAGIHVIDNSDPEHAKRVAFIEIPGCSEIAIKGNSLFTNNYMDVIEIDISNASAPVEKARIRNAFNGIDTQLAYYWQAPSETGYYQCPEPYPDSLVIRWEMDSVFANCYKN